MIGPIDRFSSTGVKVALPGFLDHLRSTAQTLAGAIPERTSESVSPWRSPQPMPPLSSPGQQTQPSQASGALKGLAWLGQGTTIRIGKGAVQIQNPLAYFCAELLSPNENEPAAVNLQLPIGNNPQMPAARELPYWPRYDQLTPDQRRIYLDWLARGRSAVPPELGYTFLFIYGLERRALLERQDVKLLFKEILRLRQLYERSELPISHSFEKYTSSFIWCLLLREPSVLEKRHFEFVAKSICHWNPDSLSSALSWLARASEALPEWLAYPLAEQLPNSHRSVVAKRVNNELRELFRKRFFEQFNAGLVLKSAKRERNFSYRPASAALPLVEVSGPHPMGVISQFASLSDIWNSCITDLKRLSTVVAGAPDGAMTTATWNAMPAEFKAGIDHPLIDAFTRFIEQNTGDNPQTIVPARALAALVGVADDAKLTAATCRRMADTIANVGYCIEPDCRITGRGYDADENVVLFLNLYDDVTATASYTVASTMLNVSVALAHANGGADEAHLAVLTGQIESAFDLNESERRRLDMLRALRVGHSIELSEVIRPLKGLPVGDRERIAKFALALVAADGVVTKEELKAVRRLYAAMGFDRAQADGELAALTAHPAAHDDPVTVMAATAGVAGEAIPPQPIADTPKGLQLNRDAINAILKDTSDVAQMLADAMNLEREPESAPAPVKVKAETPISTGAIVPTNALTLPLQYAGFFEAVRKQPIWMRDQLASLAKQHGLMLAGAVDAINEWSTEQNGGPLLYEDGQQITLETAYLI